MKHDVVVPSPGESISEVFIGHWLKKNGDLVRKGEVLVDLETQKATVEIEAEYAGRLEILLPNAGDKALVGDVIATIDDSASASLASDAPAVQKVASQKTAEASADQKNGPAVRKILAENNTVNAGDISASGKGGRVTKGDVLTHLATASTASASSPVTPVASPASPSRAPVASASKPASSDKSLYPIDLARGDREVPATRIRRQIAENLLRSQQSTASLTTFNEVDMSAVMALRKEHKDSFKAKHGVSLGMLGFFALAAARALKMYPAANAFFTGDSVIYHDYVDLSVAVSTDRGLVVPVIRNVETLSLAQFEQTLASVSERARAGKLSIPEMMGGTFTISNGGVFGSMLSTPILNFPQSAVIGLHKIEDRPVVVSGEIAIRPMMYVAMSYDHRMIDGRDAVLTLVAIKEAIENPSLILKAGDLS